jgi:hypothetical protein
VKHRYARDGIAAWVHAMSYGRIPQEARHAAKRLLLDSLACIAGGWTQPSARIARNVAEELGGPAEAHLLLTRRKTSAFNATLANGVALRALDLIEEKFEALSARHLPKARARRIIDLVWSLEKQNDINRLAESFIKA